MGMPNETIEAWAKQRQIGRARFCLLFAGVLGLLTLVAGGAALMLMELDALESIMIIVATVLMPLVGLALGLIFWHVMEQACKLATGHCPNCEYDLRGSDATTCPECGHPVQRPPSA